MVRRRERAQFLVDRLNPAFDFTGQLQVAGRRVVQLQAGANDVSGMAPGVYFVRSATEWKHAAIRRVVIAE